MSNPLLKQLISEMVGSYLEESHNDNLIETIFEEVSEETWEAIEEAILSEISYKTLASYARKTNMLSPSKRKEQMKKLSPEKQARRERGAKLADKNALKKYYRDSFKED